MMKLKLIFEKSCSLQIPYENLIAGCAMEMTIEQLFNGNDKSEFELCNGWEFDLGGYQKSRYYQLQIYSYIIDPTEQLEKIKTLLTKTDITVKQVEIQKEKNKQIIDLIVPIDDLQIPVQLMVTTKDRGRQTGYEQTMPSIMDNQKKIKYLAPKKETQIATLIEEVVYYMDLIPEMMSYFRLYQILHEEIIEGRKVVECMQKGENAHLFSKERKESFFSEEWCADRKDKWSLYMKRMHLEELSFEDMFRTCKNFMEPIWDAVHNEEIFFGDWMPEPERFI